MRCKEENTAKIPHPGQGFVSSARRMVVRSASAEEAAIGGGGDASDARSGELRLDLRVSHSDEHP